MTLPALDPSLTPFAVAPGSVRETAADGPAVPVIVRAELAEPVLSLAEHPACLDGPASFGAYEHALAHGAILPPLSHAYAIDFALPLATWTRPPSSPDVDPDLLAVDGAAVWGWACSRALYTTDLHTQTVVRKKPATDAMARYSGDRRHHLGLGPHKARVQAVSGVFVREINWYALATDPDLLLEILQLVPSLGSRTRHGHGRVLRWHVEPDPAAAEAWRARPFPDPDGQPGAIRAPYHHPTRRMLCR